MSGEDVAPLGQDLLPSGSLTAGLRIAAAEPRTWALVAFYFVSFGGFLALTAWLPTYWRAVYATPLALGGLLTFAFSLTSALVRVPAGPVSDRISIRSALTGNFLLLGAGTLIVALAGTFGVSFAGTIAIALGDGLQNAIVFKLLPYYVSGAVGGAAGWVGGLGALGGFVISSIMGAVAGVVRGTQDLLPSWPRHLQLQDAADHLDRAGSHYEQRDHTEPARPDHVHPHPGTGSLPRALLTRNRPTPSR